jgi:hypothetical protein
MAIFPVTEYARVSPYIQQRPAERLAVVPAPRERITLFAKGSPHDRIHR